MAERDDKVRRIEGRVFLADETVVDFSIGVDGGWHQWGGTVSTLGRTQPVMDAIVSALMDDGLLLSADDDVVESNVPVVCGLCRGSGKIADGPWGCNPPRKTCPECAGTGIQAAEERETDG